jgi:hypothetical protein
VERVRRWCRQRVPEHLRDQVRVKCDISRLRYTKAAKCCHCTGAAATCVSTGTTGA